MDGSGSAGKRHCQKLQGSNSSGTQDTRLSLEAINSQNFQICLCSLLVHFKPVTSSSPHTRNPGPSRLPRARTYKYTWEHMHSSHPRPLGTGTADQFIDKTLQSNGVKSTSIFSIWSPTQSSNMELKDMLTLMGRNYETNLETYWKKNKPK